MFGSEPEQSLPCTQNCVSPPSSASTFGFHDPSFKMGARIDKSRSSATTGSQLPRATAQDNLVMNVSPPPSAPCPVGPAPQPPHHINIRPCSYTQSYVYNMFFTDCAVLTRPTIAVLSQKEASSVSTIQRSRIFSASLSRNSSAEPRSSTGATRSGCTP